MLDNATIHEIAAIYAHEEYRKYLEEHKDNFSTHDKLAVIYSNYKAAREHLEANKDVFEY